MASPNPQLDNKKLTKLQSQMASKNNLDKWVDEK
jgi:hypothetical protein